MLVAVHGQSDQHRLLQQRAQREALDRFGGEPLAALLAAYADLTTGSSATERGARGGRRAAPGSGPARPTCSGSASARSRRSTRRAGEDVELAAEESRLGFADTLRTAAERRPGVAVQRRRRRGRAVDHLGGPDAARRRPRARRRGGRAGRPARRDHLPALRRRRRRRVLRLAARDRPGAAGGGLRAAGGADRADPQVRRHDRRGAGVGAGLGGPAARPRRHRRADRDAARRAGAAAAPSSPTRRRPVGGPHRGRGAGSPPQVTGELALLAMPDAPCSTIARRPPSERRLHVLRRATRSSSCSPPTSGRGRGRSTRAPPGASCRG